MKKFLLSALSLCVMTCAYAGIDGNYTVNRNAGIDPGEDYTFANGEAWDDIINAPEEGEDPEQWIVEITPLEDNNYSIYNILGWGETVEGTYDEATGILSIAGGAEIFEGYYMCGGFGDNVTAQQIMDYCDANYTYIASDQELLPIEFKLDGNELKNVTPVVIYAGYDAAGYYGYAYTIFTALEMTREGSDNEDPGTSDDEPCAIAGDFTAVYYAGVEIGADWTFANGESWDSEDTPADERYWEVTISGTNEECSIYNLLGWEETVIGVYNPEEATLTIPAGTLIDEDLYICGGFGNYTSAQQIMDYCDANGLYIYDTQKLKDIVFTFDTEKGFLSATTPILVYADAGYAGFHGYGYIIWSQLDLYNGFCGVAISAIEDENAPVEYYNLQGLRVANPANGQLVIARRGSKAVKMIVR